MLLHTQFENAMGGKEAEKRDRILATKGGKYRIQLTGLFLFILIMGVAMVPGVMALKDEFLGFEEVRIDGVDKDGDGRYSQFGLSVNVDTAHPDAGKEKLFYVEANIFYGEATGLRDDVSTEPVSTGESEWLYVPISSEVEVYGPLTILLDLHARAVTDVIQRDRVAITVEYEDSSNDRSRFTTTTTPRTITEATETLPETTEITETLRTTMEFRETPRVTPLSSEVTLIYSAESNGSIRAGSLGSWVHEQEKSIEIEEGKEIEIEARPDEGYVFSHWSGDIPAENQSNPTITIVMESDKQVTALFTRPGEDADMTPLNLTAAQSRAENGTLTISYTLRNTNDSRLAGVQLSLQGIPSQWTVVNQSADGGNWAPDTKIWSWQTLAPNSSVTPSITLSRPQNASSDDFTIVANASDAFNNTASATVGAESTTPVLDLRATASSEGSSVSPGETVTIEYLVRNSIETRRAGVQLELEQTPANWSVSDQSADGGNWAPDMKTWSWQTIEGQSEKRPSITFQIPSSASPGEYQITATVSDADGHISSVNRTVTVK